MIIHEPFFTSSIGGDTLKLNFSGSSYIGYNVTSSNPTASNEFVIGNTISGSGNNSLTIQDQIKILSSSREVVIGTGTTQKGLDSVNIQDSIITTPSSSYLGFGASQSASDVSNEIVIGIGITGSGNNTITLGNESTTATYLKGSIYRTQFVTSSITASKFTAYALSGSNYTFHLPSNPNAGDSIKISNFQLDPNIGITTDTGSQVRFRPITGSERITIGRSGQAIMGITESMQLDYYTPTFEMLYINSNQGWVIFGAG